MVNHRQVNASPTNPFTAKSLRPGTIAFVFEDGKSIEWVADRLDLYTGSGQIVGPHGTGKSTLLSELTSRFQSNNVPLRVARLTRVQRKLPWSLLELMRLTQGTQIIVDGFEQVSCWRRCAVRWIAAWRKSGLLVTTHGSLAGFPILYDTSGSSAHAPTVVKQLLSRQEPVRDVPIDVIRQAVVEHRGNIREALFSLYDWFEEHRAAGRG